MILWPSIQAEIDCYPYAYFAGTCGYKNPQYPNCARICTECIMTVDDFPVFCMSKLQMETYI